VVTISREEGMKITFMTWRTSPQERYHSDPAFHTLVDVLYYQIENSGYTPTELREACHLAACMYEERHIKPMFIDPKEPFKWNIRERK
jgi:hypothetical protein